MFIEIKIGKQYVWNDQIVEADGYVSSSVIRVRVAATGECIDVPTAELRSREKPPATHGLAQSLTQEEWERAKTIHSLVGPTSKDERLPAGTLEKLATAAGLSARQFQRYRQRFNENQLVSGLARRVNGRKQGSRGLNKITERLIVHSINKHYLTRERISVTGLHEHVAKLCRRAGCPVPSVHAVTTRVKGLNQHEATMKRFGPKKARQLFGKKPGSLVTSLALEIVQIDHTKVDIIVVSDDERREPLMRPWLTLAIDVHTRCVLGFYLALHAPSLLSTGLCIAHAMLPKEPWLRGLKIDATWPMYGRPKNIRTDNAAEFISTPMGRGCGEYDIDLGHRPVGSPHWGGHIERLIGTLMGRVHFLPGTTFSNVKDRGDEYNSEARATMTLSELQEWLVHEITGRYHVTRHKGIDTTPARAWEEAFSKLKDDPKRDGAGTQPIVSPPLEVLVHFLPRKVRPVRPGGIHLMGLRYWHEDLADLINTGEKYEVMYDPRDISKVYVRDSADVLREAALVTAGVKRTSLWEWKREGRIKRDPDEEAIDAVLKDAGIEKAERVIKRSKVAARAARKLRALESERRKGVQPGAGSAGTRPTGSPEPAQHPVDMSKPIDVLPVELWDELDSSYQSEVV